MKSSAWPRALGLKLQAAAVCALLAVSTAYAQTLPRIPMAAAGAGGYATDSILVRFKPSANASDKAQARGLVNAVSHRSYGLVRGLENMRLKAGQGVTDAVDKLSRLPFVEYAEPDFIVQTSASNDPFYGLVYAIENVGQTIAGAAGVPDADMDVLEAWPTQTGDPNQIIAVIDSGVQYDHEDLAANMWTNPGEVPGNGLDDDGNGFVDDVYGYDFHGDGANLSSEDNDPIDEDGHGSHVAGTICAVTDNGLGIPGVVKQCKIMALRFIGPQGGYTSDGVASLDYAVQMGAKISNNSWGGGGASQALYDSIAAARDADHIFLAAAGNGGSDSVGDNNDSVPHYPSNYDLPNVISVAATDNRDNRAGFSNYGAVSVDIGAPGVDIASTYKNNISFSDGSTCSENCYVYLSGTSMATPNVTGVVALIRSQNPGWNFQQVIDHLYATARPAASMAGITTTGKIANAAAAVATVEPPSPPAAPSGLMVDSVTETSVSLSWADNADNESAFVIERDGQELSQTVGANVTSFTDSGLAGATTYSYRVKARNTAGDSAWAGPVDATTDTPPPFQTVVASSESTLAGSVVSGNYLVTHDADGSDEVIRERESGGRKNSRYSYMDHRWTLSAPAGAAVLTVTGSADNSSDGDSFVMAYSTGSGFTDVCTLAVGSPAPCSASFTIPSAGAVTVRVTDTNQSPGSRALDSVAIDQIMMTVESGGGPVTAPAAPTGLSGDNSTPGVIALTWIDNADNETQYLVERSEDSGASWSEIGSLGPDATAFEDASVASLTTYQYRVSASNSAGSGTSSALEITSAEQVAPNITLQASGYKVKGWQNVDASWDAGGAAVTLYRNSTSVYQGTASSTTDGNISKGGAVYDYQVCPQGDQPGAANCSNVVTIVF